MKHVPLNSTVTVALWSAVLGCCVWGLNVTQVATGLAAASTKEFVGAEDHREALKLQEKAQPLVSLQFLSEIRLIQPESFDNHQYNYTYTHLVYSSDQDLLQADAADYIRCHAAPLATAPFITVKNRWSHGFH
jgi:hypothetical protein